ncbi:Peptide methionine sulfoxide reductase msrA [Granulibacter bethesdensis CGDNIH4]|nr:Peptide methionine sulfoxide reductase msrA [Granulibacter bethesdensis CGDNIH4]
MWMETAVIGGGCFWCVEAVLRELNGVASIRPGYAGGHTANPTYKEVCTGTTFHAEVVEVTFDPAILSYVDLLRIFLTIHDPTTPNRQGADVGTQYRSVIMPASTEQENAARGVLAEVEAAQIWPAPLSTTIEPLRIFYPAEPEHVDYFARHPEAAYCQAVIAPKVRAFRKHAADHVRANISPNHA